VSTLELFCEVTCVRLNEKKRGPEARIKHGLTRGSFLDDEVGRLGAKTGRKRRRRKRVICE
jgi:hypothetical protein